MTLINMEHHTKFDNVICYVGKDITYGVSAITILMHLNINVSAIVGQMSGAVFDALPYGLKKKCPVSLLTSDRFWEETCYDSLYDNKSVGVNCGFELIIPASVLEKHAIVNLHPAALPLNRGCHHSFWGIMKKTLLGATIHWMDSGLDTGAIINQKTFNDDGVMTANDIQEKSNFLCLELLNENIEDVMRGTVSSQPQKEGTYYSKNAIIEQSTLDYVDNVSVKHLWDLCRATCNKNNGFRIKTNGKTYLIRIKSIEELRN